MHENKKFQKTLDSVFPITSETDITPLQNSTQDGSSLCILILMLVNNRREEKGFWTEL
jgi:hypothetical protein